MSVNQPTCPGGTYTVRAGDSFWSIARSLNVSVAALEGANPGVNPNALQVGQVICLPAAAPAPGTCGTGLIPYTVKPGDTLYQLALSNSTTVEALVRLNPGIDPNSLRVGQIVCLPPPGATQPSTITCPLGLVRYTIQPGDTIWSLAQKTGTTVDRILAQNPSVNPNALFVGQKICIPPFTGGVPMPGVCGSTTRPYVVQPGDTFYSLAQRFGVSAARIEAFNPTVNPNRLLVGQTICIPNP